MLKIFHFPDNEDARLSQVGGKGLSLMKMSRAGLPVPPGFVLPVEFFEPWFAALKASQAWAPFLQASPADLQAACRRLQQEAADLTFTSEQAGDLESSLARFDPDCLFAVRSSSPEEDLEGSSFAGGYETILGTRRQTMEESVRRAFASCLDYRVAVYKTQNGFDARDPKIAVVVQQQVASDAAGVGFSLNPVSNDYDEAVFNANWGLGETVVAGLATPDTFIVDKVTMRILKMSPGGKEVSIWLKPEGGTQKRENVKGDRLCLTDEQVIALTRMLNNVENIYGKPMDIEWAYEDGRLYLLQARPVTTYVPLPPEIETRSGKRRRLYLDATISVQGIDKPLSVMSTSLLATFFTRVSKFLFAEDITRDITLTLPLVTCGRLYINLSNAFQLFGQDKVARFFQNVDPLAASAIASVSEAQYMGANPEVKRLPLRAIHVLPLAGKRILRARLWPEKAHAQSLEARRLYMQELRALLKQDMPFDVFFDTMLKRLAHVMTEHVIPIMACSRITLERLKKTIGPVSHETLLRLERSLPNNVTVEMGLALARLAEILPEASVDKILSGLTARTLPEPVLEAWDEFIDQYGHRGPGELDIAARRYRDNPRLLLEQAVTLRKSASPEDNPLIRYEKCQKEREETFQQVCARLQRSSWLRLRRFRSLYRVWTVLGGYRETPKFMLVYTFDVLRQRLLTEGKKLAAAGRLSRPDQVFDLKISELKQGLVNQTLDLKGLSAANRALPDRLAALSQLPSVVDSRGRIIRPPAPPPKEGEVVGTPISVGVARGPVKVLHSPDEKPLNRGDVLVARATDPGWTPLFVNASALVLEVGGLLQHGALVSREYGLPCVGGVANATSLWEDGTMVEVDGTAGAIRVIDKDSPAGEDSRASLAAGKDT